MYEIFGYKLSVKITTAIRKKKIKGRSCSLELSAPENHLIMDMVHRLSSVNPEKTVHVIILVLTNN